MTHGRGSGHHRKDGGKQPGPHPDAFRVYLSQIGTRPLLDREGEIAAAKCIEQGKERALEAIARSPLALSEILRAAERLREGGRSADGVFDRLDGEEGAAGRLAQRRRVLDLAGQLRDSGEPCRGSKKMGEARRAVRARAPGLPRVSRGHRHRRTVALLRALHLSERCLREVGRKLCALLAHADLPGGQVVLRHDNASYRTRMRQLIATIEAEAGASLVELRRTVRILREGARLAEKGRTQLVHGNLRLVVATAMKFRTDGLQPLDLIQEGNLGLLRAIEKFDYRRGYRFASYASWWIRQAIWRAIGDQAPTIRLPGRIADDVHKLARVKGLLAQRLGREPTTEELAEETTLPVEGLRRLVEVVRPPLSLEAPIAAGEAVFGACLAVEPAVDPDEAAIMVLLVQRLPELLATLSSRQEQVLRQRYGIGEKCAHTLLEVSYDSGVTRESVRQMELRALDTLRLAVGASKRGRSGAPS